MKNILDPNLTNYPINKKLDKDILSHIMCPLKNQNVLLGVHVPQFGSPYSTASLSNFHCQKFILFILQMMSFCFNIYFFLLYFQETYNWSLSYFLTNENLSIACLDVTKLF